MSSSAATGPLSQTGFSADEVADYLNKNPKFFHAFPNLLDSLSVPHPKSGQAISLIERQIQHLREQKESLQVEVDTIKDIAGENGQLFQKIQTFTRHIVATQTEQQAVDAVYTQMQKLFDVDQVAMLSWEVPNTSLNGLSQLGFSQAWASAMKSTLLFGKPVCGMVENDWQKGLFQTPEAMQSIALLPLGDENSGRVWGVLALGSKCDRFSPDLGTYFLAMMAEMVSARLNHLFGK